MVTSFVGLFLLMGDICSILYFLNLMPFTDFIFFLLTTSFTSFLTDTAVAGSYITFGVGFLIMGTFGSYFTLSYLGLYGNLILGVGVLLITTVAFLFAYPCVILKGQVLHLSLFK